MAKSEAKELEGTSEPFNCKTCVLRVSIHCEGCKRKVIKILHNINGVHAVEIDRKQQKVTVTSHTDEQTLIKRLIKSGKHAEPWPDKIFISQNIKEKQIAVENPCGETSATVHDGGRQKQSTETEPRAKEVQVPLKIEKKCGLNGNAQVVEIRKGGDDGRETVEIGGGSAERVVESPPVDAGDKSIAEETQPGQLSNKVAVEASGGGELRKKKKKGQRKEKSGGGGVSTQTAPAPASIESATLDQMPSSNHCRPLNQPYNYPVQTLVAESAYVASYNTSHPSSTYGSYYAAPPPYSYASYVHSVAPRNILPPSPPSLPLVEQSNSPSSNPFDFFSDENPSGCSVM